MSKELLDYFCSVRGRIHLGSFWGGRNGRCVQLTIGDKYAQMTFREAKGFFKNCIQAIEELETKYDKNKPWWEELAKQVK